MEEKFYVILTKLGKSKIANSNALGTKLNLTKFQVGDSGGSYYNPTEDQEGLKNKVWEGNINSITIDKDNDNWIVIETVIPADVGGFMIREAAVLDSDNNVIAIGKYPETYKPVIEEGSTKDLYIKMILEVSNSSGVTLKVDPTVILATKKDIEVIQNQISNINMLVKSVNNKTGNVVLTADDVGAETQAGVQTKVKNVETNVKNYTDNKISEISSSLTRNISQMTSNTNSQLMYLSLKLREQTALSLINKTGVGFYDTFEDDSNIDKNKSTATYNSTNKSVIFPKQINYTVNATNDFNNIATINVDNRVAVGDKLNNDNVVLSCTEKGGKVEFDRTTAIPFVVSSVSTNDAVATRTLVLSNGWIVICCLYSNQTNNLKFYISKDNGITWTTLCSINSSNIGGISMCSYGTMIHAVVSLNNSGYNQAIYYKIDTLKTQLDTDITNSYTSILENFGSSSCGPCSIAANSKGHLIATWSYSNSYPNIRSVKSLDEGTTWTKQDGTPGIDQIISNISMYVNSIYVQYDKNDNPLIMVATNYAISRWSFNGTWNSSNIIAIGQQQYRVMTTLQRNGANAGRIWCTWHGMDNTDSSVNNIKVSYSDDNGVTWCTPIKLTNGNVYNQINPTITCDKKGNVYVIWQGKTPSSNGKYNIRQVVGDAFNWSTITEITNQNATDMMQPSICDNYSDFTSPISIWQDQSNKLVYFYGKWTMGILNYDLLLSSPVTVTKGEKLNICSNVIKKLAMKDETFDVFNGLELNCYVDKINKVRVNGSVNNSKIINIDYSDKSLNVGDKLFINNKINQIVSNTGNMVIYDSMKLTALTEGINSMSVNARPLILDNGWIVTYSYNISNNKASINVSKDKGRSFSELCTISGCNGNLAMAAKENSVFITYYSLSLTSLRLIAIDVTSQTHVDASFKSVAINTIKTYGSCSLALNSSKTELHIAFSAKSNSSDIYNIGYCKYNINSDNSITNTFNEAVTNYNITSNNNGFINPYLIMINDVPYIFIESKQFVLNNGTYSNGYSIQCLMKKQDCGTRLISTNWTYSTISPINSLYGQCSPVIAVQKYGTSAGRIWCTWHGTDSVDTLVTNIKISYSDDNGSTWSTPIKLTNGNIYNQECPTITCDRMGNVYVIWQGKTIANPTYYNIRQIMWNGSNWSTITEITNQNTANIQYPISFDNSEMYITNPMIIYENNVNSKMVLYGKGNIGSGYTLTMEDYVTLSDESKIPIVDMTAKQNGVELFLKGIDSEKFVFKGTNLNATTAKIEIDGKDNELKSLIYTIS